MHAFTNLSYSLSTHSCSFSTHDNPFLLTTILFYSRQSFSILSLSLSLTIAPLLSISHLLTHPLISFYYGTRGEDLDLDDPEALSALEKKLNFTLATMRREARTPGRPSSPGSSTHSTHSEDTESVYDVGNARESIFPGMVPEIKHNRGHKSPKHVESAYDFGTAKQSIVPIETDEIKLGFGGHTSTSSSVYDVGNARESIFPGMVPEIKHNRGHKSPKHVESAYDFGTAKQSIVPIETDEIKLGFGGHTSTSSSVYDVGNARESIFPGMVPETKHNKGHKSPNVETMVPLSYFSPPALIEDDFWSSSEHTASPKLGLQKSPPIQEPNKTDRPTFVTQKSTFDIVNFARPANPGYTDPDSIRAAAEVVEFEPMKFGFTEDDF